jgi:cytochrome P450
MDKNRIPPGPRGLYVLANLPRIARNPLAYLSAWKNRYGDVVRIPLGSMTSYLISQPDDIEQILRHDHRDFIKDKGTRLLGGFLGKGLLTSEGELWRRQRHLAQPAFQLDQVQKYADVMVAFTERMLGRWRHEETRDLHSELMRLTLDIAARTLFGTSVEGKAKPVGQAMEVIMRHFATIGAWFPWLFRLPTPGNIRFRKAQAELNEIIYETIAQRRAAGCQGEDLLARLLAARDEDGSQMTDRQLRDEVVTLFLAGHETTALALCFTFYLLARHPEVEAWLFEELREVLQGRLPTAADVPRLHYAEWIVRESMRLYPPAPAIGREALEDCEVGGYPIAKGSQFSLVQWVVHRDPRWFGDPESFKPERWDHDLARRLPRCAYFPFGDGPRVCIGSQFAMMETILVLCTVVQRFRLRLERNFKLDLLCSITLRPKHGLPVILEERETSSKTSHVGYTSATSY